ncbi:MAG: hypothetical protein M0Z82_08080 [Actinomycetota bacterium]|nr:hypothetical protein [Actinomycetota bacterium]
MKPADVPARPLLVDTNVVSQSVLREGRWEEFDALIGARLWYINFAVFGELATFAQMQGIGLEKRTTMTASALSYDPPLPIVTANLDDFQLLAAAEPRILLVHPDLS